MNFWKIYFIVMIIFGFLTAVIVYYDITHDDGLFSYNRQSEKWIYNGFKPAEEVEIK